MEKEVSLSLQIGVTLLVLSIVISLVAFTVHIGNDMKADAYESGNRMLVEIDEGYLQDMVGQENYIPSATAYNLMRTFSRHIPHVECEVPECTYTGAEPQNLVYETPCLIHHRGGLTGKVSLEVTNPDNGIYHIIIHPDNSWFH